MSRLNNYLSKRSPMSCMDLRITSVCNQSHHYTSSLINMKESGKSSAFMWMEIITNKQSIKYNMLTNPFLLSIRLGR